MFQKQINYSNKNAHQIFNMFFNKQRNIITPYIIYRRRRKNYVVELSEGEGIFHQPIYGVTVLELKAHNIVIHRTDISQCFGSLEEAESYIKSL